jgi:hypothetical protein
MPAPHCSFQSRNYGECIRVRYVNHDTCYQIYIGVLKGGKSFRCLALAQQDWPEFNQFNSQHYISLYLCLSVRMSPRYDLPHKHIPNTDIILAYTRHRGE